MKLLIPLLAASATGSIFYLFVLLCAPFLNKLRAKHRKFIIFLAGSLFLIPLPFFLWITTNQPSATSIQNTLEHTQTVTPFYTGGEIVRDTFSPAVVADNTLPSQKTPHKPDTAVFPFSPLFAFSLVYIGGFSCMMVLSLARYRRLRKSVFHGSQSLSGSNTETIYLGICKQESISSPPQLYRNNQLPSPLLVGSFSPVIVFPNENILQAQTLQFALQHELIHFKSKDLLLKEFLFFIGLFHWFNPLFHLLRRNFSHLCEQSCDEELTKNMPFSKRKEYALSLVSLASFSSHCSVSCFAAQASEIKKRLVSLLSPQKPKPTFILFALVSVLILLTSSLFVGCSFVAGANSNTSSSPSLFSEKENASFPIEASSSYSGSFSSSSIELESGGVYFSATGPPLSIPRVADSFDESANNSDDLNDANSFVNMIQKQYELYSTDTTKAEHKVSYISPVPDSLYSSRGLSDYHRGVDLNAPQGTPIYAANGGVVLYSGFHYSYGYITVLKHNDGIITVYAHCDSLYIAEGEFVKQGQQVADVGSTGNSSGPHCHVEFWNSDFSLEDPLTFINIPNGG